MKVLVTGANGYLGQGIVKQLLDDEVNVVATDCVVNMVDPRANIYKCDLFSIPDPYTYFGKPDILLHLAWRDGFKHNSETHIYDLQYHYAFIKKMIESGLSQIAVMGTMHEVGFHEGPIKEDTKTEPLSLYGISKNTLRTLTRLLCDKHKTIYQWLRGYYIVGNTEYGASIFSKIKSAANSGAKSFPFTSGLNQYDFIDYDEFCKQVASVIQQNSINGIINICSGHPQKLSDRVQQFIIDNNLDINLEYGAFPERPYDSKASWGDNTKITQILNKNQ